MSAQQEHHLREELAGRIQEAVARDHVHSSLAALEGYQGKAWILRDFMNYMGDDIVTAMNNIRLLGKVERREEEDTQGVIGGISRAGQRMTGTIYLLQDTQQNRYFGFFIS